MSDGPLNEHEVLSRLTPFMDAAEVPVMSEYLLEHCPVAHSENDGGFWMVTRHADLLEVCQASAVFINGSKGVRVPDDPIDNKVVQPPIDSNGAMHRDVRNLESPFLSPAALKPHEPRMREIIGDLLDVIVAKGQCDFASEFADLFPPCLTFEILLGVDDADELAKVRAWSRTLTSELHRVSKEVLEDAQAAWAHWTLDLIQRRRSGPRRHDIVDSLLYGTVEEGRPLTDREVQGAIEVLCNGGFSTTSEATGNIVVRLIADPSLEAQLRADPSLIPAAVEEVLRLDAPVTVRPRKCTQDYEIDGQTIPAGDRVLLNYFAANIDPYEWERPHEFDMRRRRNRVMTFGAGPHRCIGSNFARLTLRLMVEELLARVSNIRFAEGQREQRVSNYGTVWRKVVSVPITFDAIPTSSVSGR